MDRKYETKQASSPVSNVTTKDSNVSHDQRELVERAQAGDREAFEELVRLYDRQILRLAFHMLGDHDRARDVYQETFLKAYRSIGRFRADSSFYTWIYRIAKNVCLDHRRMQQRLGQELPLEADRDTQSDTFAPIDFLQSNSLEGDPERSLFGQEIRDGVNKALEKLTDKERRVFELRHYHGLRLRAVGEAIGMTEDTAKNYLFHGTKKMRAALAYLRVEGGTTA